MIVTIAECAPPGIGALVAENLALLRARSGRKVLLLDAGPGQSCRHWGVERAHSHLHPALATCALRGPECAAELERLHTRYGDIVIATDGCSGQACRWALIAAQVALVPVAPECADVEARYGLIAAINSARMFKPGLRVLFVTLGNEGEPASRERSDVRAYAAQVMSAEIALATLHLPALQWGADAPGRCACDIDSSTGAAEMAGLYGEVYRSGPVPACLHEPGGQTMTTTIWNPCKS